jgi:hypothetical protein
MSNQKMMDEFERIIGEPWNDAAIRHRSLWVEAWKASRQALVIELPHVSDDDLVEFKNECIEAIQLTGAKVK